MIKKFQQKSKIKVGTNSTFLPSIPKETNPGTFFRFRSISLCNASYKICSKLMANRLKTLLHKVVSHNQGGFINGRHISDNVILVQEMIHSSKARKEKGMIIKVDMSNVFNVVKHSFLYRVLEKFGFNT